jgi:hypothetical protein
MENKSSHPPPSIIVYNYAGPFITSTPFWIVPGQWCIGSRYIYQEKIKRLLVFASTGIKLKRDQPVNVDYNGIIIGQFLGEGWDAYNKKACIYIAINEKFNLKGGETLTIEGKIVTLEPERPTFLHDDTIIPKTVSGCWIELM